MTTVVIPAYTIPARNISVTIPAVTIPAQTITLPDPPVVVTPPPVVTPPTSHGPNTATLPSIRGAAPEVIALPATNAVVAGSVHTTDLDLTGLPAGSMVKGATFNGCGIIANTALIYVNCVWNNSPSKYPAGACVTQCPPGTIFINPTFNTISGLPLNAFGWNNVRVLCPKFINCQQDWSMGVGSDGADGNNIELGWVYTSGFVRGGFETGGDTSDTNHIGQVFTNLYVHDGIFVDQGPQANAAINALSIVARGQRGTRINDNFFRLGTAYGGGYAAPIETSVVQGTAVVIDGNTFVDFANGQNIADNGVASIVTNNKSFNCNQVLGGSNVALTTRPADPVQKLAVIA